MTLASDLGFLLLFGLKFLSWAPLHFSSWSNSFHQLPGWSLVPIHQYSSYLAPWLARPDDAEPTSVLLDCHLQKYSLIAMPYQIVLSTSCLLPAAGTIPRSILQPMDLAVPWIPVWTIFQTQSWSHLATDRNPALLHGSGKRERFKAIHILKTFLIFIFQLDLTFNIILY